MYNETVKSTRQELYDQVWSQPLVKLAKVYEISDVGLRKICKRYNIPLPPQGFWARKRKPSKRPPLLPQKDEVVVFNVIKRQFSPGIQKEYEQAKEQAALEKKKEQIPVSSQLRSPHQLVSQTLHALENSKKTERGILLPKNPSCLDVDVTPNSFNRALRIMDALIKALDSKGYKVAISLGERNNTYISYEDEKIDFGIEEFIQRRERKLTSYQRNNRWALGISEFEYIPTGVLSLKIKEWDYGFRKSWSDGKKQRVEECLNGFIANVIKMAAARKAERVERERKEQERLELQRIRDEKARLKKEEAARVKALEDAAEAWFKSNQIRSYIKAVKEISFNKLGSIPPDLEQWLLWANQHADRLDPLIENPHSLLDE